MWAKRHLQEGEGYLGVFPESLPTSLAVSTAKNLAETSRADPPWPSSAQEGSRFSTADMSQWTCKPQRC